MINNFLSRDAPDVKTYNAFFLIIVLYDRIQKDKLFTF